MALGGRIDVVTQDVSQMREVASGGAYASQYDLRAHFGLGESETIDRVAVRWPDGTREVHEGLGVDRIYLIKRGVVKISTRWIRWRG